MHTDQDYVTFILWKYGTKIAAKSLKFMAWYLWFKITSTGVFLKDMNNKRKTSISSIYLIFGPKFYDTTGIYQNAMSQFWNHCLCFSTQY